MRHTTYGCAASRSESSDLKVAGALQSPDEIWLSPMCGPLWQIQELNCLTPKATERLLEVRDWHEKHVLACAKIVDNKQVMSGKHAHLEQHPR